MCGCVAIVSQCLDHGSMIVKCLVAHQCRCIFSHYNQGSLVGEWLGHSLAFLEVDGSILRGMGRGERN